VLERFTWFRQSAMRYAGDGLTVYIDPWGTTGDDPPADLILITHAHSDHLQPDEIARLSSSSTKVVAPHDVARELSGDVTPVAPGESHEIAGVHFQTVPAYNIVEERLEMHPKSNGWVGYVVELGNAAYYHAGDTDHLPELESIRTQVAFLPIGGTYTMDVEQAGVFVRELAPEIAVPMHYGFVVGSAGDADAFRIAAQPVRVETLTPTNPFERP
jgi:L-ascorbate metabolism protein UlaG (beta-lactamase superfamily)